MSQQDHLAVLAEGQRNELEAMLLKFDESWEVTSLPKFVDHLPESSGEEFRKAAIQELVKIDLHRKWAHGTGELLESYIQALPELGSAASISADLILAEYEARSGRDNRLDASQYRSRFPQQYSRFQQLANQGSSVDSASQEAKTLLPQAHASIDTSRLDQTHDTSPGQDFQIGSSLPEEFGRYRIIKELGSGAMGSVYLAHDTQLDRQVALKTPNFNGIGEDSLADRFSREARAAAKLQHRNICPVFDVGEIAGRQFISMAFIKGRCMSEFIKPGKLPPARTSAALIHRLAIALAEAHRQNVIHRDLKPANIMIDTRREPIVMDFGLARRIDVESRLTATGMAVGTPAYMSPEQVRGAQDEIGPGVDIYSLGVIFYELLTGQLPFQGQIAKVVYGIVNDEPAKPSQVRAELPPVLEQICLKMMAKKPEDRYSSMEEVAAAIKTYLQSDKQPTASGSIAAVPQEPIDSSRDSKLESHSETNALNAFFAAQGDQRTSQTLVEPQKLMASATSSKPSASSARNGSGGFNKKWLIGGLGGVLLLAIALGVIFLVKTPYGTLRIETIGDLDGLEVIVDGEAINLVEKNDARATEHDLQLKLGESYLSLDPKSNQFVVIQDGEKRKVSVTIDGLQLSSRKFSVARKGETVLTIELLEDASDSEIGIAAEQGPSNKPTATSVSDTNPVESRPTPNVQTRTLFNGQDLAGWEVIGFKGWTVENGAIVGRPPNGQTVGNSWLMNQSEFEDFELEFEYQLVASGNSGVFLRTGRHALESKTNKPYEVQLLDDTSSKFKGSENTQLNGALWKTLPANPSLGLGPNQWHRMRIRIQSDQLNVWSNDEQIVSGKLPPNQAAGNKFGFQLWSGVVKFRNIGIQNLTDPTNAVASGKSRSIPWTNTTPETNSTPDPDKSADDTDAASIPWTTSTRPATGMRIIESGADMRVCALAPDSRTFAATGVDTPGSITIWDSATGAKLRRFDIEGGTGQLAYSPSGKYLIVKGARTIRVVDINTGQVVQSRSYPSNVGISAFPERNWVAVLYAKAPVTRKNNDPVANPSFISVWDWESNEVLFDQQVRAPNNQRVYLPVVSPDAKWLALAMRHFHIKFDIVIDDDGVRLENQTSMEKISLARGPLVFSPNGRFAVGSRKSNESLFVVLDAVTGRILHKLDKERRSRAGNGSKLAFAADGIHLVVTDWKGGVSLWNAESGTLIARLHSHEEESGQPGLLLTPDNRLITLGGTADRTIVISELNLPK